MTPRPTWKRWVAAALAIVMAWYFGYSFDHHGGAVWVFVVVMVFGLVFGKYGLDVFDRRRPRDRR